MTLRTILVAAALLASMPTEAASSHCYSRWYYPWPQRCFAHAQILARVSRDKSAIQLPTKPKPAIALPGLARTDLDGGLADEPTRARLLLRGILGVANAR